MKRKSTEKTANIFAVESSDEDDDNNEEQESQDELEMEGGEEESSLSDNDEDNNVEDTDQESDNDLDASATESDEDEDDNDDLEEDVKEDTKPKKTKAERIREELLEKYQERQGKQLYIRFPHKVAETDEALEKEVKELTPLAIKVHKPRQKHARFCLVDFATNDDRDIAFKQLKKTFSKGDFAKYVVNIPKTESQELVSDLAERKIKSIENKKAKNRLKKASRKALTLNNFTSTVIVLNLPKTTSVVQIRELFPNAIDIQVKSAKGKTHKDKSIAAITLPSTMDARFATKKKLSLGGNQLIIKFDNQKMGRNKKPLKESDKKAEEIKTTALDNEDSEPATKKPKLETDTDTPKGNKKLNKGKKPFNKGKKVNEIKNTTALASGDSEPATKKAKFETNLDVSKGSELDSKNKNPFNKDRKPFNKDNKQFGTGNKPFNKGNKQFGKGNKPFNKGKKPFNKVNKGQNNFKNKPKFNK